MESIEGANSGSTTVREHSNKSNSPDPLWGDEWIDTYLEVGSEHSYHNEPPLIAFMFALLGQSVRHGYFMRDSSRVNVRVHPTIIQPSQTGKGETTDFAEKVGRKAGINFKDIAGKPSDAAFVETKDEDGESIPGLADKGNILMFREFGDVLSGSQQGWAEDLHSFFIHVYDGKPMSVVRSGETRSMHPIASVVGTCTPPPADEVDVEKLFGSGLMARPLYFYRDIGTDIRRQIENDIFEGVANPSEEKSTERRIEQIAATLEEIRSSINEGTVGPRFEFNEDAVWHIQEALRDIHDETLDEASPQIVELIGPARTKYILHSFRIACLMASLDECSTTVNEAHAERAMEYVRLSWTQLMDFLENHMAGDRSGTERKLSNVFSVQKAVQSAGGSMTQSELIDEVGKSRPVVRSAAKFLIDQGRLEESGGSGRGNVKRYSLKVKGER